MTAIVIADELTAAGFRLAGVRTLVPPAAQLASTFEAASEECELLLVTAAFAAQLPPGRLDRALLGTNPLVLVIPDALRRHEPPDLARALRGALGVET